MAPVLPTDVIQQFREFAAPQPTLLNVQLDYVTAYIRDTVDLVDLAMQANVSIDTSSTPNNPTNPFYNMFPLEVVGDIVKINGDTVKGLYLSKNLVTLSSSTPATAAPTSTPISAGQMISDAPIVGFRHDIFKILNPDLTEIGSITAAGVSGKPVPPGGPAVIEGGDWAITGGTGAFLGVTGQMGGQGVGKIRTASVTEDPSQRKANASPSGKYTQTIGLYVIPMMPPQIIEVFALRPNHPTPKLVTQDHPAKSGDTLILYVTGLGPVRDQSGNDVPIGQPFPANTTLISPVTVTIGNTTPGLFAPQSAQGCEGFSNGYVVELILPHFTLVPPEMTSIQISSAWIQSATAPFYVA